MEKTVAETVTENYKTASVFKKYGIDFCCGGKKTISQACKEKGIDEKELLKELEQTKPEEKDANKMNVSDLIDYIVDKHHTYTREKIPEITQYAEKIAKVHGKNHPELIEVDKIFKKIGEELLSHLEKEEKVLFPHIKNSDKIVEGPIHAMEHEHEIIGEQLKKIREITNNYTLPENACNTYRVTFKLLEEFEEDVHKHIHLENNILFPKAVKNEHNKGNTNQTCC